MNGALALSIRDRLPLKLIQIFNDQLHPREFVG
jgi:hypothetical protein